MHHEAEQELADPARVLAARLEEIERARADAQAALEQDRSELAARGAALRESEVAFAERQRLVAERAAELDRFPQDKLLALSHCILAHHGPDALPGRRFRSAEALALHRLNSLDAAVKGALEQGLPA